MFILLSNQVVYVLVDLKMACTGVMVLVLALVLVLFLAFVLVPGPGPGPGPAARSDLRHRSIIRK